jgi:hypothetical protein
MRMRKVLRGNITTDITGANAEIMVKEKNYVTSDYCG